MWRRAYAGNIACGDPSWVSAGQRDVVPTHPVLLQHIRENEPGAPRRSTDIRRVRCRFLMEQRRVGADVDEAALAATGAPACVTEAHHTIQAAADLRLVNWLCGLMRQRHIDFQEHRGRGTKIRTGLAVTAISEQRATAVSGMRRHVFCRMLHLRRSGLSRFWLRRS